MKEHARPDNGNRAAISLTTGLEDAEKVTVAFLVAVGAAESGRPTQMFLTKDAVRLVLEGPSEPGRGVSVLTELRAGLDVKRR